MLGERMRDARGVNVGSSGSECGMLGESTWDACCEGAALPQGNPKTFSAWSFLEMPGLQNCPSCACPLFPSVFQAEMPSAGDPAVLWYQDSGVSVRLPFLSPIQILQLLENPKYFFARRPQLAETPGDSFTAPHPLSLPWNRNEGCGGGSVPSADLQGKKFLQIIAPPLRRIRDGGGMLRVPAA